MSDVADALAVLQFGDSFFPSGAVSFSWGLEGLSDSGVVTDADAVRAFVIGQLRARWAEFDRPVVVAAHRARMEPRRRRRHRRSGRDANVLAPSCAQPRGGWAKRCCRCSRRLGIGEADAYRERVKQGDAFGHLPAMQGYLWGRAGLSEPDAVALSAHTFSTGLLGAGIRLGCLSHIDAQQILIEARRGGCKACRAARAADRRAQRLRDRGRDRRDAARQQQSEGVRQLAPAKSGRCSVLLTPTEMERLTIYVAAELARKHKAKGLPLNHPEAVAYIVDEILEGAREGRSVADLIAWGSTLLTTDDVMPGVAHLMPMIQVEGTFPDGTKLVTIHDPIRPGKRKSAEGEVVPGEIIADDGDIELNAGRRKATLKVVNTGDRPIQIGSHYHFFETNKALDFDREKSFGMHLDIPAGTSVRFAPGESKEVVLTEFGGTGELLGLNGLTEGNWRSEANKAEALQRARARGFKGA